eukprot:6404197-Pyramimonas_sp.AAC.1
MPRGPDFDSETYFCRLDRWWFTLDDVKWVSYGEWWQLYNEKYKGCPPSSDNDSDDDMGSNNDGDKGVGSNNDGDKGNKGSNNDGDKGMVDSNNDGDKG